MHVQCHLICREYAALLVFTFLYFLFKINRPLRDTASSLRRAAVAEATLASLVLEVKLLEHGHIAPELSAPLVLAKHIICHVYHRQLAPYILYPQIIFVLLFKFAFLVIFIATSMNQFHRKVLVFDGNFPKLLLTEPIVESGCLAG